MLAEINITAYYGYEYRRKFNLESNVVSQSIVSHLSDIGFDTGNVKSLQIRLEKVIKGNVYIESSWKIAKQVIFDFDMYWEQSLKNRQLQLGELLSNEMLDIAARHHWNRTRIIDAVQMTISSDFEVMGYWNDPIVLIDGEIFLGYRYEGEFANIFIVKKDGERDLYTQTICKVWPNRDYLNRFYGSFESINENELILRSYNNEFSLKINLIDGNLELIGEKPKWVELMSL